MLLLSVVPSPKYPRQAKTTPQVRRKICAGFSFQQVTHVDTPFYICNPQKSKKLISPDLHKKCPAPSLIHNRSYRRKPHHIVNTSLVRGSSSGAIWKWWRVGHS